MRVHKRPFVSSQQNTKFYGCTQTVIRFFTAKYEILQLYPNGHSFFHSEMRNFTGVPKRPFVLLQRNTTSRIVPKPSFKIFKVVPKL